MGGPRRLEHGRERRNELLKGAKRKLFFSTLCMLPLLTSCASATPSPNKESRTQPPRTAVQTSAPRCLHEIGPIPLQPGESIRETVCRKNHIFVLTNTSLLIVPPKQGRDEERTQSDDEMSLKLLYKRTDMSGILSRGLVAWAQSDDTCYFLTRDRVLTPITAAPLSDTIESYEIRADISSARMRYFSGMIFIAPASDSMVVLSFSSRLGSRDIPLRARMKNPDFFVSGGRLFFGDRKNKIEIVTGRSVYDVRLVRR